MQVLDTYIEKDEDKKELVLEMSMSAAEVKPFIDDYYKELNQQEISGFRKGHAPREVLERSVGGKVKALTQIAEKLINAKAFEAIDEAGVIFLGDPEFNVVSPPDEKSGFTFSASGLVEPEIALSSYDEVEIEMPPSEVSDKEVEDRIESLREYYYTYEDITDPKHIAQKGDFVLLTMSVDNKGKAVSGLNNTQRMIELGAGSMPQSFDEHIIGSKKDDELEFDFEAKGEGVRSEFGDGNLHAKVKIDAFRKRNKPDLDDAFAAKFGAANVEDLYKQTRISIDMQKAEELPKLKQERCLDALTKRIKGDIPSYFLDHMRELVQFEFMQDLQKKETDLRDFILNNNMEADELKQQFSDEAISRAETDLVLEALAKNKGWTFEKEEDIKEELKHLDVKDVEETFADWKKNNRLSELRKICRENKASRWLDETAKVTIVDE